MAVTKIWDVRGNLSYSLNYVENEEKTAASLIYDSDYQTLSDVMSYAENEEKTEHRYFVSTINCNVTCARDQFVHVKKAYDKEGGIVAYHAYQSFAPGETTPEQAHQIGVELAERMWGDRFQVVVATHLNTHCLHNHFIINSVSFRDGKRYHDCKDTYRQLRLTSDEICRAHGLSVVEQPHRGETEPLYMAQASAAGMPTRYNVTRSAIDEAISKSHNMREFEHYLKKLGYTTQFDPKRKYWTVTPAGWKKPIRLARLGEEYTNERIRQRVMENPVTVRFQTFQKSAHKPRQYLLLTRLDRINKKPGLQRLYLRYLYELGYLPRYRQNPNRVHSLLKDDLMRCEKLSQQARLLAKHDIETLPQLQQFMDETTDKKELRLCRDIMDRHEKLQQRISTIDEEREHTKEMIK